MSDPIYDRYKTLATEAENEEAERRRRDAEEKEAERQRLIASIPAAVDEMFERQERTRYADEVVRGQLRFLELESGEVQETVMWIVGRSEPWRWTFEDMETDAFFITSGRLFGRTVGAYPRSDAPLKLFGPAELSLKELRELVAGIDFVGRRRSEIKTHRGIGL